MSAVMPRMMELSTPLGKDLLFRWLRGKEELGRPSEFELAALSTRNDIKPSDLLGKKITVKLERVKGGLAVDIGLVNTPLETIYEIRDVLRRMQDSGDILFIGERKQLVFHVVPHPSRLGHFNDVYAKAIGEPLTSRSAAAG